MADENVPTAQPAPEDPGVDPAESATSGQASTDNASSAIPQSDGAAPDLVHAGPSSVPTARESIGAQTVRLANNPVYMEDLRSRDAELYDYMVAVRDRRTSDPRSLDLGIRLPTGEPGVHGRLPHRETITMNGTLNGTTNGATHLNGAPRRTLNGPTPETRVRSFPIYRRNTDIYSVRLTALVFHQAGSHRMANLRAQM
jgi:hypothetical protein